MIDFTHEINFGWPFGKIFKLHFEFELGIFEDSVPNKYYSMPDYVNVGVLLSIAFACGMTYIPKFAEYRIKSLLC